MKLQALPFGMIKDGTKTVECRLYDEKRQTIAIGDEIVFSHMDDPEQTIKVEVKGLLRYATFADMFEANEPHRFGGTDAAGLTESLLEYYSLDQQREHGVLGIDVKLA